MKNRPTTWVDKTLNGLERVSNSIAGMLFILNIVNIGSAVFSRYVLKSSFIWTAELSQLLMAWMVLIAASATLKRNEHMKIDLLLKYMPPIPQKILAYLRHGIVIFISLFMTIKGFSYANSLWKIKTLALHLPKSILLFAVSIGMGLFVLMYILLRISGKKEIRSTLEGV